MKIIWIVAVVVSAMGCGEWVKYDGEGPEVAPGRDLLVGLGNVTTFDHVMLDGVFQNFTTNTDIVRVDYLALEGSAEGRFQLDNYLNALNTIQSGQLVGQNQRLAYWLNGYNANMLDLILRTFQGDLNYSPENNDFAIFRREEVYMGQESFSLNHIEHGIIRGDPDDSTLEGVPQAKLDRLAELHNLIWSGSDVDARIHMALNCASAGCPDLYAGTPQALKPALLDSDLDQASTRYLDNTSKGASASGVSSLFTWFAQDFITTAGSVDTFIETHRTQGLEGIDTSSFIAYSWDLNAEL
jgi:hypothetical protein